MVALSECYRGVAPIKVLPAAEILPKPLGRMDLEKEPAFGTEGAKTGRPGAVPTPRSLNPA